MELHSLTPADWPLLRSLCGKYQGDSCELAFANLVFYAEPQRTMLAPYRDGAVVVFAAEKIMLPPFGTGEVPPGELARLARECRCDVYDAAPRYPERFPDCADYFSVAADPGEADYIYDVAGLVENSGSKRRKKRNLIRQFDELYPDFRTERVTPENAANVVQFAEELNTHLVQADFLAEENAAMERAARCFDAAALHGVLLYAEGRPAGFSLFSRIGASDVWDVHFEKANHAFKGAPQKLTQSAASAILELGGRFMNREQDMNEPGLRHAKTSLDPVRMYRRLHLCRRETC